MPYYEHENWGDIQKYIFMKGTITAINSEYDTADVRVPGGEDGPDIPLFYHCSNEAGERSNGAIEGAAGAFGIDDEVIVMCEADTGKPVRIVGFVGGIKSCGWRETFSFDNGSHCTNNHWIIRLPTDNDNFAGPSPFYPNPQTTLEHYYSCKYKTGVFDDYYYRHDMPFTPEIEPVPWGIPHTVYIIQGYGPAPQVPWVFGTINQNDFLVDIKANTEGDNYIYFESSGEAVEYTMLNGCVDCAGGSGATFMMQAVSNPKVSPDAEDVIQARWRPYSYLQVSSSDSRYSTAMIDPGWNEVKREYALTNGFQVIVEQLEVNPHSDGVIWLEFYYSANITIGEVKHTTHHALRLVLWARTDKHPTEPIPGYPDCGFLLIPYYGNDWAFYPDYTTLPCSGTFDVPIELLNKSVYDDEHNLLGNASSLTFGAQGRVVEVRLAISSELLASGDGFCSYGPMSVKFGLSDIFIR